MWGSNYVHTAITSKIKPAVTNNERKSSLSSFIENKDFPLKYALPIKPKKNSPKAIVASTENVNIVVSFFFRLTRSIAVDFNLVVFIAIQKNVAFSCIICAMKV